MVEKMPSIVDAAAKFVKALTAKQQTNAAEKVMEKVVEALVGLGKDKVIAKDTLLSAVDGLAVDKQFTLLRGQKKKVTISLGSPSEE